MRILIAVRQYQHKVFRVAVPATGLRRDRPAPDTIRACFGIGHKFTPGAARLSRCGLILVVAVSKVFLSFVTGQILRKLDGGASAARLRDAAVAPRVKARAMRRPVSPRQAHGCAQMCPPGAEISLLETNPPCRPVVYSGPRPWASLDWRRPCEPRGARVQYPLPCSLPARQSGAVACVQRVVVCRQIQWHDESA